MRGMSSEEKRKQKFVGRELTGATEEKRRKKVKKVFASLKEEGWGEVWDDRTLRHVASSEQTYLSHMNRGTSVGHAEILETLMNWGITEMGWLGNHEHTDDEGKVTKPFLAYAESTRAFDDKRHRVDTVVSLKVGEDVTSNFPTIEDGRIEMALDVTVWARDVTLAPEAARVEEEEYFADKISRANNETNEFQEEVPFGFTQVDFYKDPWEMDDSGKRVKRALRWVPRFVVGVNGEEADEIRKRDFRYDKVSGKYVPKDAEIVEADWMVALAGFKVMSEILAQAEMLMQMMPDKFRDSNECMAARERLAVIRDKMRRGLRRNVAGTARLMAEAGVLPDEMARVLQGASVRQAVVMLERGLMEIEGIYDPTYAGIIRATESFKGCAASPKSEILRQLRPRNRGVKWTGVRTKMLEWE